MEIRAAVTRQAGQFSIEPVELDDPQGDEVLVRLVATGMCHTDLVALDQHMPYPLPAILGHEGVGVIERAGPQAKHLRTGDHVVLSFAACGHCGPCQSGRPAYCQVARQLNLAIRRPDGRCAHHAAGQPVAAGFFGQSSFASHALVRERDAVRVRKDVSLSALAPLGCSVQTGAGGVLNVLKPAAGSSIAVFGLGAVGLSAVMAARLAGCARIIAIDLHPSRLDMATEFGATDLIQVADTSSAARVQTLVAGGVDFAVEATGIPAVMAEAVAATHRTGTSLMLGLPPPTVKVPLDAGLLLGGRTIRASIEGDSVPGLFIPQLVELQRTGQLPFERMCRTYPLDAINDAVRDCRNGSTVKPIITMDAA